MHSSTPPPGWFPDPTNSQQMRWWDGHAWSDQTTPRSQSDTGQADIVPPGTPAMSTAATKPAAPKKPWYFRWWAITAAVLIALSIVGSLLPDEQTPEAEASSSETTTETEPITASPSPTTEPEPVDTDGDGVNDDEDYRPKNPKVQTRDDVDTDNDGVPDYKDAFSKNAKYSKDTDGDGVADQPDDFPKNAKYSKDTDGDGVAESKDAFPRDPSRSRITLAMENALTAAQDYLDYSPFSRQGLIDQLSSKHGSGFKVADATWAVEQLTVDWKQQAVKAAKDYLDYSPFSRQGLIDQLSSTYGSQFTLEEATYAVNKIGL